MAHKKLFEGERLLEKKGFDNDGQILAVFTHQPQHQHCNWDRAHWAIPERNTLNCPFFFAPQKPLNKLGNVKLKAILF